ncbi:MAG: sigma-70 family RNA polymerase sigma factor [Bacteroidetes bacterium]|nr:sigma-70 family RNA polymerase sigma factor [Bacteroidota bacterium]
MSSKESLHGIDKIIKGCVAGNTKYQELLYKQFSGKMFAVCLRYAKDYTEAEDVLQEGFIKVFEKINQFKFKGSFEGWMRRVIVNTALDKYRKQNLLHTVDDMNEYSENFNYDEVISNITSKDILKLIQELSPKYKMVFVSYAIEGYSHKEISEMLGISIGTSKSNLSRARHILQIKINKYFKTDDKIKFFK